MLNGQLCRLRLKANKAAKRREEKGETVSSKPPSVKPPPRSQPAAVPPTKHSRPDAPAPSSSAYSAKSNHPTKHHTEQRQSNKAQTDEFANVDVAALAKRATSRSHQSNDHQASRSSKPDQNTQGVVSRLFTGYETESIPNSGGLDTMDRKTNLNASNAPLTVSANDDTNGNVTDDGTFEGLGLDPLLADHLKSKMGIERPTRIQRVALKGLLDPTPLTSHTPPAQFSLLSHGRPVRDAFIQSQTGSGKTLSYLLPIIQTLLPLASSKDVGYVDRSIGTLGIVLAPTRELARQIWGVTERILGMRLSQGGGGGVLDDMAKTLPAKDGGVVTEDGIIPEDEDEEEDEVSQRRPVYQRYLVTTLLTGGSTRTHEKSRLRKGCPILISTPGRLLDHLQNTQSFKVDRLLWLVLDEADRLIEEGFGETLEGIMKAIEGRRRIGIELDGQGLGRSKTKKFVPPKAMVKAPFENGDDEDDDEDEDDDWDYELSGPKPKAFNPATGANGQAVTTNQAVSTQMNWPYWPLGRRTILCSATVSGEVQKLAGVALKDPVMYRASNAGQIEQAEEVDEDEPDLEELAMVGKGQGQKLAAQEDDQDEIEEVTAGKVEKFTPPSQLDQRYMIVPLKLRLVSLVSLLRALIGKANTVTVAPSQQGQGMKVIVFMSCTDSVDFHWKLMGGVEMGGPAKQADQGDEENDSDDDEESAKEKRKNKEKEKAKKEKEPIAYTCPLLPSTRIMRLHGSLPLQTRRESLQAFSQATSVSEEDGSVFNHSILFCTSVASRGLDLPLVRAVIQYDLPTEQGIAEYVHRVGRTARVGKGGESWAFVESAEKEWIPWVQEGMSSNEKDGEPVKMRQVAVEDVLRKGFSPKSGSGREFEQRATQVQLAFERWVLDNKEVSLVETVAVVLYTE